MPQSISAHIKCACAEGQGEETYLTVSEAHYLCQGIESGVKDSKEAREPDNGGYCRQLHKSLRNASNVHGGDLGERIV